MRRALVLTSLLLFAGAASADATLRFVVDGQCPLMADRIDVSGSQLRVDSVADERRVSMLYDGAEELLTSLIHDQQRYWQVEVDDDAIDYTTDVASSTGIYVDKQMQKAQAMFTQQCEQMNPQGMACAGLPDMASMLRMGAAAQPTIEVRPTDRMDTVAGVACRVMERWQGGIRTQEECYASPSALPISTADQRRLSRGMKAVQRYGQSFAGLRTRFSRPDRAAAPDLADDSLVLKQTCVAPDGTTRGRAEVKIDTSPVDAARFDIPGDYRKLDLRERFDEGTGG